MVFVRARQSLTLRVVFLSVLLGELDSDVVATEGKTPILTLIGPRRVGGLEVLDEGETLDGAEVGRGLIHIARDIDVLDGAVLLEYTAQLLDANVTRQVAGNHGLDARSVSRNNTLSRCGILGILLDNRPLSKCYTAVVRADAKDVRLTLFRRDRGSALTRLVVKNTRDITPLHRAVPEGFHKGVRVEPSLEKGVR